MQVRNQKDLKKKFTDNLGKTWAFRCVMGALDLPNEKWFFQQFFLPHIRPPAGEKLK
jgi:hypothetical protein